MPRNSTALDLAATALSRHLKAVARRQEQSPTGELNSADLASIVRAADLLRAIEYDRLMIVLKMVGRRLATMDTDDLQRLIASVVIGDHAEKGDDAN